MQIDDDVEIGAGTMVDRARFGRTWIGEGTKIDNLVQIGHNVVIGKHCIIVAGTAIAGSAQIGDYVVIAAQVGIAGHVKIGSQARLGGRCGVTKDLRARRDLSWIPRRPRKRGAPPPRRREPPAESRRSREATGRRFGGKNGGTGAVDRRCVIETGCAGLLTSQSESTTISHESSPVSPSRIRIRIGIVVLFPSRTAARPTV